MKFINRQNEVRVAFINDKTQHVIRLHKPHPGNILKKYQLDFVEEGLRSNGRIAAELHKKAVQKSLILGISLNKLVQRAIEKEIGRG